MKPYSYFILLIVLSTGCCPKSSNDNGQAASKIEITGHRGGVTEGIHPENSRAALDEALKRGYSRVEIDVRQSCDSVLFLCHDRTFKRYYGVDKSGEKMNWSEIQSLKSDTGTPPPLSLEEYCRYCTGKVTLMVDIKEDEPSQRFYRELERILSENNLLQSAYFIGHGDYFRGKARITMLASEVDEFYKTWGDKTAEYYFLFDLGNRINSRTIKWCQRKNIPVVIAINKFHYIEEDDIQGAGRDIRWLLECGVTEFQIDSQYDQFLINRY